MSSAQPRPGRGRVDDSALECSIQYLLDTGQYHLVQELLSRSQYEFTPSLLLAQALCHFHEKKWEKTLEVLLRGARLGWDLPELHILKGRCLFNLAEYDRAIAAFTEADEISSDSVAQLWILRCQVYRGIKQDPDSQPVLVFKSKALPPAPTEWRHDYYHTTTHVVVTVYISGLTADQLEVVFEPRRLTIRVQQKEAVVLRFRLENPIIPDDSKYVLSATKVEVKMAKATRGSKQWYVQPEQ